MSGLIDYLFSLMGNFYCMLVTLRLLKSVETVLEKQFGLFYGIIITHFSWLSKRHHIDFLLSIYLLTEKIF